MSLEPPTHVLKDNQDSILQKISKDSGLHSYEGVRLSRDQTSPHPKMKENFDFMMNSDMDPVQDYSIENQQELKRNKTEVNIEPMDTTFRPITATCRLFSNTFEDGLQAKNGLSQFTTRWSNLGDSPLMSLAGVAFSLKARGRAISSASDSTIFSSSNIKSRCSKCGKQCENVADNYTDKNNLLTPNPQKGKYQTPRIF